MTRAYLSEQPVRLRLVDTVRRLDGWQSSNESVR